ncbi:unannotated protein [freshwater metagenome]|uniref:Unannotated protein n=1 Tax=freshwater metagenome TaxID=449393 RepID=A0A6J6E9B2_9ZZZZ
MWVDHARKNVKTCCVEDLAGIYRRTGLNDCRDDSIFDSNVNLSNSVG